MRPSVNNHSGFRIDPGSRPAHGVGLLSGGLDSMLAVKVLRIQGITVTGVTFRTPFFGSSRGESAARALGIDHVSLDITEKHLEMVKDPEHGYGRNMNPCIDCHAMMFAEAGGFMADLDAHFLFSGEVLGQRPMSQNLKALRTVEKASGFEGLILRPLSARLLPETIPEREGLVDRDRLLDIKGRSRRRQMELAERWGIDDFHSPGGGCLLTDPGFSRRLRELLTFRSQADRLDIERLKAGRHFRLPDGSKAIVGRHHMDNERLEELAKDGDTMMRSQHAAGPLTVLEAGASQREKEMAAALTVRYGKQSWGQMVPVRIEGPEEEEEIIEVRPMAREEAERYRVR